MKPKNYFFLLFVLFNNALLAQTPSSASKKIPLYADAHFGFFFRTEQVPEIAELSLGYTINDKHAVGLSRTFFSDYVDIDGVGLQYRATPTRHFMYKMEVGYILRASTIDSSGPTLYDYLPSQSKRFYVKPSIYVRFARMFTFGVSYPMAGESVFRSYTNSSGVVTERGTYQDKVALPIWHLGVALPSYAPKKSVSK